MDWVVTAVGLFGFWLAGSGVWWSWWVNVANQALWLTLALATGQYGFLAGVAVYAVVFTRNAVKATREHRTPPCHRGPGHCPGCFAHPDQSHLLGCKAVSRG